MNTSIELINANIGYSTNTLLKDVNLSIPMGSITLIVGPNGSGKTTLAKTILKLLPLISGSISTSFRQGSYVQQKSDIDSQFPLNLVQLVSHGKIPNLFAGISKQDLDAIHLALEEVGLEKQKKLLVRECSGGQLQRAMLARAFYANADFLILDEPFSNIDKSGREDIKNLIQKIHKHHNATILIIDHHLNQTEGLFSHCIELETNSIYMHEYDHT